ncbi:MAG: AarF/ABC1/UbiB kinase family protein [Nitrospirae bacterium]|nr:AarF/ABC1/UbiB kinase family protein [Nitrospirota bacterium]MBF0542451.1 AarF/ABC1/UbiB kinase family protein [Nitrospirota bacterium]
MLLEIFKLRKTYRNINRIRQILNVFVKHGFGQFIELLNLHKFIPFRKRLKLSSEEELMETTIPERLRLVFEELGPSFIKLAQVLASRPDLISDRYADEFEKLQDEASPFPFEAVKIIFEQDTGLKIDEVFSSIEKIPAAAASIAQVHFAELKDGSQVVLKVQRPNISHMIENDISIMSIIVELMVKYIPETEFFNPKGIVNEYEKTIKKELNFLEEARNIERFHTNFHDDPEVKIPKLYKDLTTSRVIVMERIVGIKIDDLEKMKETGIDMPLTARRLIKIYFKMMLEHGFFHADPHPGNIFVMADGRIGIVDFGIVGWLSVEVMDGIAGVFLALVNKDFSSLFEQFIELGMITDETDYDKTKREFMADVTEFLTPMYDMPLADINYVEYLNTITHLALKHKVKVPSSILMVNKCNMIIDGLVRRLDSTFNFITVAAPYASKIMRRKYDFKRVYGKVEKNFSELSDSFINIPKQTRMLLRRLLRDEFNIRVLPIGLERFQRDIDRSTNRLSFSIVVASIIMSSSVLALSGIGGKIFSMPALGTFGFVVSFILGVWLLLSILRSGRF